jgi:opacity protein-like surface antigen
LAKAQPRFSLAIFGGFLSDVEFGRFIPLPNTADVPDITTYLENRGPALGLSLGYAISDRFELRGTFSYGRSEIIHDVGIGFGGFPLGRTKVSDVKNFYYSGNLLYHIPFNRISPYITVGLGVLTLKAEELNSKTKMFLNFGTGVKFKFTQSFSMFCDVKDHLSFFNYPEDFDIFYVSIYAREFKKSQHSLGIRLGLIYSF